MGWALLAIVGLLIANSIDNELTKIRRTLERAFPEPQIPTTFSGVPGRVTMWVNGEKVAPDIEVPDVPL